VGGERGDGERHGAGRGGYWGIHEGEEEPKEAQEEKIPKGKADSQVHHQHEQNSQNHDVGITRCVEGNDDLLADKPVIGDWEETRTKIMKDLEEDEEGEDDFEIGA